MNICRIWYISIDLVVLVIKIYWIKLAKSPKLEKNCQVFFAFQLGRFAWVWRRRPLINPPELGFWRLRPAVDNGAVRSGTIGLGRSMGGMDTPIQGNLLEEVSWGTQTTIG